MKNLIAASLVLAALGAGHPAPADDPQVIKIGIVDSLIRDLSPGKQKLLETEFPDLVKEFTGFNSMVSQGGDPFTGGMKLAAGDWHLGVFQGVEFAWAQSKEPKLRPLTIAVARQKSIQALLVAGKDSGFTGFADLKGKDIHVLSAREHCRLFADKGAGGDAREFFGKVLPTNNTEEALDNILRGKVHASVVDNAAMESYDELQPGRFKRLKALAKSEAFPAAVIAYSEGALSQPLLDKFRDGMLRANQTDKGRDAMASFRIAAFEVVPKDYARQLADIVKAYPPPAK
ncbi:MAG: PhnD/SsuA/transferrin family substrate-binding protein [Gemmataceae bacterium]|nr:PhnD/SsuA/transferrin family substrate-binding protein [Gemmataceae bacterium]